MAGLFFGDLKIFRPILVVIVVLSSLLSPLGAAWARGAAEDSRVGRPAVSNLTGGSKEPELKQGSGPGNGPAGLHSLSQASPFDEGRSGLGEAFSDCVLVAARPNPYNRGNCYQWKKCLGETIGNMWVPTPGYCGPLGGKSWKGEDGACIDLLPTPWSFESGEPEPK
ncbi:MAG: hypothetical protein LBT47_13565 [Deltaproteobacteria bacterium]|nr:hypothetical protein [Deltaproteobacteria bacterium]